MKGRAVKIIVDIDRCTGHGRCYAVAPDVYEPDDDGYCQHLLEPVPPELRDRAVLGAANCPEAAITVIDDERA